MDEKSGKKLAQSNETIRRQRLQIEEMHTPVMMLWNHILFLPIIGVIDTNRAQVMMDALLNDIDTTQAKVVILDILGVLSVDSAVANHLIKITKATKLMGCDCIISGVSPEVAKTIVNLGVDLAGIMTEATLKEGLVLAFNIIGLQVKPIKEALKKALA